MTEIQNGPAQNQPPARGPLPQLSTPSWIAIIVGIAMLAGGIIFDVDARSVGQRYEALSTLMTTQAAAIAGLLTATTANTTNIINLTTATHDLKVMVEDHILRDGGK